MVLAPEYKTVLDNVKGTEYEAAVLEYIEKEKLADKAKERGAQLTAGLMELQKKYSCIGDIRGLGLMIGAEFITEDGSPNPELLDKVLEEMKDRGYIIGKNGVGRNVMAFQPPLVITEDDINNVLNELDMGRLRAYTDLFKSKALSSRIDTLIKAYGL